MISIIEDLLQDIEEKLTIMEDKINKFKNKKMIIN